MQRNHLRKAILIALASSFMVAGQAYASDPSCPSPTYSDMRKAAEASAKGEADDIKSLFDQVRNMDLRALACLDKYKNMKFGMGISWMTLQDLFNKVAGMVCNAADNAYNKAFSGLNTSVSKNLQLPGGLGTAVQTNAGVQAPTAGGSYSSPISPSQGVTFEGSAKGGSIGEAVDETFGTDVFRKPGTGGANGSSSRSTGVEYELKSYR